MPVFDFPVFLFHRRHLREGSVPRSEASRRSQRGGEGDGERKRRRHESEARAPWRDPEVPEPPAPAMAAFPQKDLQDADYLLQQVTEEAQRAKEKIAEVTKEAGEQKAEMMKQHEQKLEALEREQRIELDRMEKVQQEQREKMIKMQQDQKNEMEEMRQAEKDRMTNELQKEQERIDAENAEKAAALAQVSCLSFPSFIFPFQFQNPDIVFNYFSKLQVSFKASKVLPEEEKSESAEDAEEKREDETLKQQIRKQRKLEQQNVNLVKLQFELMEKAARLGRKLCEDRLQEIEDSRLDEVGKKQFLYFFVKKIFALGSISKK